MSALPLVIINPVSAGGATGEAWPGIASDLRTHFGPFKCVFTESAGDASLIAEREALGGRTLIIACGGDGTISEVVNGILRSGAETELGVLPSGTGGDFRRSLQMPTRTSDAARALRCGHTRRVDAVRVTFSSGAGAEETRYFINVASFGMGGAVIKRVKDDGATQWLGVSRTRLLGGRASFATAALQTTLTFEKPTVELQLDGRKATRLVVANLCVANAQYFGGGMRVAPTAKLDDGLLDVVAIGDLSALEILTRSYRIYLGTHLGLETVQHARARKVTARAIEADSSVLLELDGELAGHLPAVFEILPRAIRVRCP